MFGGNLVASQTKVNKSLDFFLSPPADLRLTLFRNVISIANRKKAFAHANSISASKWLYLMKFVLLENKSMCHVSWAQ